MALHLKTKERLQRALGAFNLENLFKYALPGFEEVELKEIYDEIKRNRLESSKRKVISLFMNLLGKKELSNEECERRTALLLMQAVALKPERCLWAVLQLRGESDMRRHSDSLIEDLVSRSLRRNGVESIVRVFPHSSAYWIGITVKKISRKKLVLSPPVFCTFYPGQPFIFVTKGSAVFEVPLVEALGYVGYTKGKLTGHDVKEMLEILVTKNSRPEHARAPVLNDEPTESTGGLDYSQAHHRKKYMRDLFSPDTPRLSHYAVECREAPWYALSSLPQMQERTYRMRLRFKTKDAVEMFRALAEEGFLELPVPTYVSEVLRCARNDVRIKRTTTDAYDSSRSLGYRSVPKKKI